MTITRRSALLGAAALAFAASTGPGKAAEGTAGEMLRHWYKLVLRLVRHTATYSPPVASRSFAYLGVAAYQAVASASSGLASLQGQLNGLAALPSRAPGARYAEAVIIHCVMASAVKAFFGNTGPTGLRVMAATEKKLKAEAMAGVPEDVAARSIAFGEALTAAILAWSENDGGAVIENMGFPMAYDLNPAPGHWVPTSAIRQQQAPLLPAWGQNRTFAMRDGTACAIAPPPAYSEDRNSAFYSEAREVYDTVRSLTKEQETIARFWSDDPMLSPTPPGHWISIALEILEAEKADADKTADVLMRLGVTLADAFIGCWAAKFQYDLVRPVTYIRKVIDPKFEPLLITPPFPEYPSGHSVQSGAAAVVLTAIYGENFAFTDSTHVRDGIAPRSYTSFAVAAEEAGISRLYGGIHFRSAVDRGLEQGRCIGQHAVALKTRGAA